MKQAGKRNLREFQEHVNFSTVGAAFDHAVHHVHHPCGTLTTGSALTTRFVFVELETRQTRSISNLGRDLLKRTAR